MEGEESSEVGDCYSLLGRTLLVSGNLRDAEKASDQAVERLIDTTSKDYLDLQILLGDIAIQKNRTIDAISSYNIVLNQNSDNNYPRSEITARAFFSRAKAMAKTNRPDAKKKAIEDYQRASDIWSTFGENDLSVMAEWEAIRLRENLPHKIVDLLENEEPKVRVEVFRIREEQRQSSKRDVIGQRVGTNDELIWKRLIKMGRERVYV